ncbi:MAG: DUF1800 domain-containing protein [Acidimicrobiia bacterium]
MTVSERERIAHVVRRLSMAPHAAVAADLADVDAAVARTLDLSAPGATPLAMTPPDGSAKPQVREIVEPIVWWLDRMGQADRMIEERLTWFWHDHFATSVAKVREPYLMYRQHLTIRQHATGNFAELLKAVARDPAMLIYLDGLTNAADERNENFGRECLELFTMGRDSGYTQDDVVAASRAFTGWVVDLPGRPFSARLERLTGVQPWDSVFVGPRHDAGEKTLLGVTGAFDMDGALDVILDQPATAVFVTRKLFRELVGLDPDDGVLASLAKGFRRDYEILPLVTAIVQRPEFTAEAAVRAKVRTPVEKLVGIRQAGTGRAGGQAVGGAVVAQAMRAMAYVPFVPPNVGGFPKGTRLLGPANLVHTFDLVAAAGTVPASRDAASVLATLGVHDVSSSTKKVLDREVDARRRFALAVASPEYAVV